jgi:hypothetical protein
MSRLYYDKPTTNSRMMSGQEDSYKEYGEKVAKLIPSEIIAFYLTAVGLVPLIRFEPAHPFFFGGIFFFCLIITPFYLNIQADKNKPKTIHIILSTFAFILWAYATSGQVVVPMIYDPAIASIALGAFSLVSGKIPLS